MGLDVPQAVELAEALRARGIPVPEGAYLPDEVAQAVLSAVGGGQQNAG